MSFSPDGSRIATADDAGEVRIWELGDGRLLHQFRAHEATIWDICYSTKGLITASTDQSVRVWDAESLAERSVLRGHGGEVWKVAVAPDSTLLASGGKDGTVRIWSLDQPRGSLVPTRHVQFWNWPVFSEDGEFLAIGETAGVNMRRTEDGSVVRALAEARRPIAFTSGGRELITLGAGGELQFWDWTAETRQPAGTVPAGLTGVRAHALCSRSNLLALGDREGNIRLWDFRRRTELGSWKAHLSQITSLAVAPDGHCLASGSVENEGSLKLWHLPEGTLKAELAGHKLGVFGVAFSPDGQLLASASVDDTCRLWNPTTGQEIAALGGHKGGAFNAAFSADGRTLLVGTGDGRVKLWNLATFRDMGTMGVEPVAVFFTGFVPGQPTLATVSFDAARTNCSLCLIRAAPVRSGPLAPSLVHP